MSLGQSVEAGTWLIAREVWRRSDVAPRPAGAHMCAPPGYPAVLWRQRAHRHNRHSVAVVRAASRNACSRFRHN